MSVSPQIIGALVGLAFAVAEYFWFGVLISRQADRAGMGVRVMDGLRKLQLIVYPVIGWLVGPLILDNFGA